MDKEEMMRHSDQLTLKARLLRSAATRFEERGFRRLADDYLRRSIEAVKQRQRLDIWINRA